MIEKITSTGRKVLGVVLVYFLGVISVPPSWNFWTFAKEISQNPEYTPFIFFAFIFLVIIGAAFCAYRLLFKEKGN